MSAGKMDKDQFCLQSAVFSVDSFTLVTEEKHVTKQKRSSCLVTARVCVALTLWLWLTLLRSLWSKPHKWTHSLYWFLPSRRTVMSYQQFQGFNYHHGSFPVSQAFKIQSHILSAAFPNIQSFHIHIHTHTQTTKSLSVSCMLFLFMPYPKSTQ